MPGGVRKKSLCSWISKWCGTHQFNPEFDQESVLWGCVCGNRDRCVEALLSEYWYLLIQLSLIRGSLLIIETWESSKHSAPCFSDPFGLGVREAWFSNQFYLNNPDFRSSSNRTNWAEKNSPWRTISICKPLVSSLARGSSTLEESYQGLINLATKRDFDLKKI